MTKIHPDLLKLIKSWHVQPGYLFIVVSIAAAWKTPARWTDNLLQVAKNRPEFFR